MTNRKTTEFKWLAKDGDGQWYLFSEKPKWLIGDWQHPAGLGGMFYGTIAADHLIDTSNLPQLAPEDSLFSITVTVELTLN